MEKRILNTGDNRIITPDMRPDDRETELSLRPMSLDTYVGQTKLKENMRVYMEAAKQRGESLPILLQMR